MEEDFKHDSGPEEPVRMMIDDDEEEEEDEDVMEEEQLPIENSDNYTKSLSDERLARLLGKQDRIADDSDPSFVVPNYRSVENEIDGEKIEVAAASSASAVKFTPADSTDLIDNGSILFFDDPKSGKARSSNNNVINSFEPGDLDEVALPTREALAQNDAVVVDFNEKYNSNFFIQRMQSDDIVYETQTKPPKFVAQYLFGTQIGEGSYGKVKEAFDSETLQRVAIKIMKKARLKKIPNGEENVKREISLLRRLKHPNVVQLLEVLYNDEKKKMYVVFEYCSGNLQDIIDQSPEKKLGPTQSQDFFRQLMEGLGYLHSKSVIHRDIKPQNLLITVDGTLKVSDFGVAEELGTFVRGDNCSSSVGSPAFQSPEVALGLDGFSGAKVDVWAAGVTLYHMVSGKYPFEGDNVYSLFENIGKGVFDMPTGLHELLENLIAGMLCKEANDRLSVSQILCHPWLYMTMDSDQDTIVPLYNPFASNASLDPEVMITDTTLTPYLQAMYQDELNYLIVDVSENEKNVMSLIGTAGENSSKSSFSSTGRRGSKMEVLKEYAEEDIDDSSASQMSVGEKVNSVTLAETTIAEDEDESPSPKRSTIKLAPRLRSVSGGRSQSTSNVMLKNRTQSLLLPNAIKSISTTNIRSPKDGEHVTILGSSVTSANKSTTSQAAAPLIVETFNNQIQNEVPQIIPANFAPVAPIDKSRSSLKMSKGSGMDLKTSKSNIASVESISKRSKPSVSVRRPFFFYSYASKKTTLNSDGEMVNPPSSRPSTPHSGRPRKTSGFWNFMTSGVTTPIESSPNMMRKKQTAEVPKIGQPIIERRPSTSGSSSSNGNGRKSRLCILQ